jgi:hypothetical protein
MAEPLARTDRGSLALSSGTGAGGSPGVHRVLRVEGGEVEVVGDRTAAAWLDVPAAAPFVRAGDLLLATLRRSRDDHARVEGLAVLLPAAAAELIE